MRTPTASRSTSLALLVAVTALALPAQAQNPYPYGVRVNVNGTYKGTASTIDYTGASGSCSNSTCTIAPAGGAAATLPAPSGAGKMVYDTGAAYAATAAGTSTQVLHGAAGSPTWGAVGLTTDVTGTLPTGNGGTGVTTCAAGTVLAGPASGAAAALSCRAVAASDTCTALADLGIFPITCYGAVCDGATNDAAAIQAAGDAVLATSGGGTVLIPEDPEGCLITSAVTWNPGSGLEETIVLAGNGGGSKILINFAAGTAITVGSNVNRFEMRNLSVVTKTPQGYVCDDGCIVAIAESVHIHDVDFWGLVAHNGGLRVGGNIEIDNIHVHGAYSDSEGWIYSEGWYGARIRNSLFYDIGTFNGVVYDQAPSAPWIEFRWVSGAGAPQYGAPGQGEIILENLGLDEGAITNIQVYGTNASTRRVGRVYLRGINSLQSTIGGSHVFAGYAVDRLEVHDLATTQRNGTGYAVACGEFGLGECGSVVVQGVLTDSASTHSPDFYFDMQSTGSLELVDAPYRTLVLDAGAVAFDTRASVRSQILLNDGGVTLRTLGKTGTTAGRVATLGTSDTADELRGVFLDTASAGNLARLALPGQVVTVAYSGSAPAIGDCLGVSGAAAGSVVIDADGPCVGVASAAGSGGTVAMWIGYSQVGGPFLPLAGGTMTGTLAPPVITNGQTGPGVAVVYVFDLSDAAGDTDITITHKTEVVEVLLFKKTGAGGAGDTVTIKNSTTAITNAMSINVADKAVVRNAEIDDAANVINAAGTLRVTITDGNAGATDLSCRVFVRGILRS